MAPWDVINAFAMPMNAPDPAVARKATNITVSASLLARAKALKINVSQASEEGLARAVAARQAALWLENNQAALDSSNAWVDQHGLPLASFRNF